MKTDVVVCFALFLKNTNDMNKIGNCGQDIDEFFTIFINETIVKNNSPCKERMLFLDNANHRYVNLIFYL